jgi:succinyl-CoA synthetase beta subunit
VFVQSRDDIERYINSYIVQHHAPLRAQVRQLSLLEHHSHNLLKEVRHPFIQPNSIAYTTQFKIPVPPGFLVTTPEKAKEVVSVLSKSTPSTPHPRTENQHGTDGPSMIKAQVLAGGRGKGKFNSDGQSGVRLVES